MSGRYSRVGNRFLIAGGFAGICLFLVLVALLSAGSASGRTITVDDDGGADYETIQDAVDAAEDGDTISVASGYYSEDVVVEKELTIQGAGWETTTINGPGSRGAAYLWVDNITLTGFTITTEKDDGIHFFGNNIVISDCNITGCKDGVYPRNGEQENQIANIVRDCIFFRNEGNGIYNFHANANRYENNTFSENGMADISIRYSKYVVLHGNRMKGNGINLGGEWSYHFTSQTIPESNTVNGKPVIYLVDVDGRWDLDVGEGGQLLLAGCTRIIIDGHRIQDTYIGIQIDSCSEIIVRNCVLQNNTRSGISVDGASKLEMIGNSVIGNGVGIACYDMRDSVIMGNEILENEGGMFVMSRSDNTISGNVITENSEYGIYVAASDRITIFRNTISGSIDGITFYYHCSEPRVLLNTFSGPLDQAINADRLSGDPVNATHNWYGHSSGPFHPDENPDGVGKNVTDDVVFDPWLRSPYSPPTVSIDSFEPSQVRRGNNITFVPSSVSQYGILEYQWTDIYHGTASSGKIGTWSTSSTLTRIASRPGAHTMEVFAVDVFGVNSEPFSVNFTVLTVPEVEIDLPRNDTVVKGSLLISGSSGNPDGEVLGVEVSIENASWEPATGTTNWEWRWNTTSVENGTYRIRARAFDGNGTSKEVWIELIVRNEEPDPPPEVEEPPSKEEDEEKFIPGFTPILVLPGLLIGIMTKRKKWKRREIP